MTYLLNAYSPSLNLSVDQNYTIPYSVDLKITTYSVLLGLKRGLHPTTSLYLCGAAIFISENVLSHDDSILQQKCIT